MMFKSLDPLLNSEVRLGIMSLLIGLEKADFKFLKEKTGASSGNLSVQVKKLSEAGYISVEKSYKNNYPLTTCRVTKRGMSAFELHIEAIKSYLSLKESDVKPFKIMNNIKTAFCIISFILSCITLQAQEREMNTGMGLGYQLIQYQEDFGMGVQLTSPYFLYNKMAVRLKANLAFNQNPIEGETEWIPYGNVSLGLVGLSGRVGESIRLYGEGGALLILPPDKISSESTVLGGYGLFGFEFYFADSGNYFIEIGGVGTGATADKIATAPIYSNGLSLSVGLRFVLD